MRFLHTADLHIGKKIAEFSMLPDQEHILKQILQIAIEQKVDGMIIAGDIYDRGMPSAEAVSLMDWFLTQIVNYGIRIFLVSGNHDCAQRVGFARDILEKEGVFIAGVYSGEPCIIKQDDSYGELFVCLLPFVKPETVKFIEKNKSQEEEEDQIICTYEDGMKNMLNKIKIEKHKRKILVTHCFACSSGGKVELSDSEIPQEVGGIDSVNTALFEEFDYVALGHIHAPQKVGKETIRYSGSPIKYSFSEVHHTKSVVLMDIKEKGNVKIQCISLKPLHDMRKIKGRLSELTKKDITKQADTTDYLEVTLTDKEELLDPMGTLRAVYPNVMQLIIEKKQKEKEGKISVVAEKHTKSALELFEEFYEQMRGEKMTDEQRAVFRSIEQEILKEQKDGSSIE